MFPKSPINLHILWDIFESSVQCYITVTLDTGSTSCLPSLTASLRIRERWSTTRLITTVLISSTIATYNVAKGCNRRNRGMIV